MSRRPAKRNGDYPEKNPQETETFQVIRLGSLSILLTKRESEKQITIYLGGPTRWCVYCELPKVGGQLKDIGYLNKVRFDLLCSMEHSFAKGHDTKQLIRLLVQYIHENYPSVTHLSFNDTSTKACDNKVDTSLAFMTFLYTEQTWYEKNFRAFIATQSKANYEDLKRRFMDLKQKPWEEFWEYAYRGADSLPIPESVLKGIYDSSETWKEFYGSIVDRVGIAEFCNWISFWSQRYMHDHGIHFMTFTFHLPIRSYGLSFTISQKGGRRRRRYTRKQ